MSCNNSKCGCNGCGSNQPKKEYFESYINPLEGNFKISSRGRSFGSKFFGRGSNHRSNNLDLAIRRKNIL